MNRYVSRSVLKTICFMICPMVLWASHSLAGDWEVVRALPGTGAKWAATSTNSDGHKLYIWRVEEPGYSEAYIGFHLGKSLRFSDAMPTYQIDEGEIVDTGIIRKLGNYRCLTPKLRCQIIKSRQLKFHVCTVLNSKNFMQSYASIVDAILTHQF